MFTRVNAKQELFLVLLVDGATAEQAYAQVYDPAMSRTTAASNASRLLTKANIIARRQELVASRHQAMPISVDYLSRELLAVSREARALAQTSAAAQALMGVAKLHGLLVDKVQSDVLIRKPSSSPESPDDLSAEAWLTEYASTKLIENNTKEVEPSSDGGSEP